MPTERNGPSPLENIAAFVRNLQRIAEEAMKPGTKFREFLEALPAMQEKIERFPKEAQQTLHACEFPAFNSFFSLGEADQVVRIFKAQGPDAARLHAEAIARAALDSVDSRERLLNEWQRNQFVAPRLPILRDALDAHCSHKYTLSVPVFIAQLEGVVAVAAEHKGQMRFSQLEEYVEQFVANEKFLGPHVKAFVGDVLLAKFEHGTNSSFDLSRHAILHGGDTQYGTERNSIRSIVLFDYIQSVIERVLSE